MSEGHGWFNVPTAVRIGRALEGFDITWFEEPIPPDDLPGLMEVKRRVRVPVAGGERLYSRWDSRDYINRRCVDFIQPDVSHCGGIGESVVLAVMQGARRYVLLHENCNPALNIDVSALYYDDLYLTATGRVLLAHASAADLNAVINKLHLPDSKVWLEAVTAPGLNRELRKIRQDGFVFFRSGQTGLQIMAAPIWEADRCLAALGASFPSASGARAKHARTLAAVRTAAAKITQKLAVIRTAG